MTPSFLQLEIELHEAVFFASHEIHDNYLTEALIGNYALAYALGLVASPYDRVRPGYGEDLPLLVEQGIYVTPAWPANKPRFRVERFNCQSESFYKGMTNNAVLEIAGRQYLTRQGNTVIKYVNDGVVGKRVGPVNRPQTGILKLLAPQCRFRALVKGASRERIPSYIRVGKFMSKAKVRCRTLRVARKKQLRAVFELINPLDISEQSRIVFGDTVNIHPVPLIRNAEMEGLWWVDDKDVPVVPAGLRFQGF